MSKQYRKLQTIEAIEELIYRYQNPGRHKHLIMHPEECPLCKIHKKSNTKICRGCPLANVRGTMGCIEFKSFKNLADKYHNKKEYYSAAQKRGMFFKRILPIIKKTPAELFTELDWVYSGEISRLW